MTPSTSAPLTNASQSYSHEHWPQPAGVASALSIQILGLLTALMMIRMFYEALTQIGQEFNQEGTN